MCQQATAAGVKIQPILREIAELSSDQDKYGMGATKDLLLNASDSLLQPTAKTHDRR
jgi:hypothetical protein